MEKIKITSWNRKSRKEIQHREEVSQNGKHKSSDTYTDLSNRIFIIGDTIVKHVKITNYDVKWKIANTLLRVFWVQM